MAIAALWPFHRVVRGMNLSYGDVIVGLVAIGLVGNAVRTGRCAVPPVQVAWASFIAAMVFLSALRLLDRPVDLPSWDDAPGVIAVALLKTMAGVAWCVVVAALLSRSYRENMATFLCASLCTAVGVALLVLFQAFVRGQARPSGTFENPNLCAGYLAANIGFAMTYRRTGRPPLWAIGAAALLLLGVVATASRSGMLGAVVVIGLSGVPWRAEVTGAWRRRALTLLCLAGVVAGVATTRDLYLLERVSRPLLGGDNGRFVLWQRAWRVFSAHPIIGVGLGRFPEYEAWEEGGGAGQIPHNVYLTYAAETGLVGLLLFGLCFLSTARAAWRLIGTRDLEIWPVPLFALVCAFAFHGLVGNFHYHRSFWVVVGLVAAASARARSRAGAGRSWPAVPSQQRFAAAVRRTSVRPSRPGVLAPSCRGGLWWAGWRP